MRRCQTEVLIHVEESDFGPVEIPSFPWLAISARLRVLPYLFAPEASDEKLANWMPSAVHGELAILLRDYLTSPTFPIWQNILRFVMQHRERVDLIYIAYRLATYLPPGERPASLTSEQARLFSTTKPWDYLEPLPDPIKGMEQVLAQFLDANASPPRLNQFQIAGS